MKRIQRRRKERKAELAQNMVIAIAVTNAITAILGFLMKLLSN